MFNLVFLFLYCIFTYFLIFNFLYCIFTSSNLFCFYTNDNITLCVSCNISISYIVYLLIIYFFLYCIFICYLYSVFLLIMIRDIFQEKFFCWCRRFKELQKVSFISMKDFTSFHFYCYSFLPNIKRKFIYFCQFGFFIM